MDLIFKKMGMDFSESDKKDYTGDIFNHRIRAEFSFNGVDFLIECCSCRTWRKKHKITGAELKNRILISENNGIFIEIFAVNLKRLERSCSGVYGLFNDEKTIFNKIYDDGQFPRHKLSFVKLIVESQLKITFDSVKIM